MKATEKYFPLLFITLFKVVLTFEPSIKVPERLVGKLKLDPQGRPMWLKLKQTPKGRTIRKLFWGGGAGAVQKKYSRKGKLNEKNCCTPINPKKYSCYGLK